MIRVAAIRFAPVIAACVLEMLLGGLVSSRAEHRAFGLALQRESDRTRLEIRVETLPVVLLQALDGDRIRLAFRDTALTEAFRKEAKGHEPMLSLDNGPTGAGLLLDLPGPLKDLSAAWLAGPTLLSLELGHPEASRPPPAEGNNPGVLQPIHFGSTDGRTRMVMALDRQPAWELELLARDRVRLRLPSVRPGFERNQYGPADNLALATLRTDERGTDIDIRLLTGIDRLRVFWAEEGAFLVTDLFQGSSVPARSVDVPASGTTTPPPFVTVAAVEPPPAETAPAEAGPVEAPGDDDEPHADSADDEPADGRAHAAGEPEGPVFRGRIPRKDVPSPGPTPRGRVAEGTEPVLGPAGGPKKGEAPEEELLRELDPSEALLYGEIQEAAETGDHSRAAELCARFLERHPESPLAEIVLFMKGDAELGRIEAGDKKQFSRMMKTYQEAVSRFRRSPEVPRAYLNMARASSLVGNDFAAIGYLNIVLHGVADPDTLAGAHLQRGRLYLKVNRPDKAVEDFKAVLEDHPGSSLVPEARMGIAGYFEAVGLHEKAGETLRSLCEERPGIELNHPELLFLRGKNALYLERYDSARDFFFRALNVGGQPESADLILARIGDTYHHAGRPREAETIYQTVIRDYPDSNGASMAKLRLAGYRDGYQAFRDLLEAHADRPLGDLAALEMARKHYEEKQYVQVLEVLRNLLNKPFQSDIKTEARRLFVRAAEREIQRLHKAGEHRALVDFHRAEPSRLGRNIDPETRLLVGLSLHELEDHVQAAEVLAPIQPYDLDQVSKGRRALALVESLLAAGEEDRALAQLERRDEKDLLPAADRQKLNRTLADLYLKRGRPQEALALYRELVEGKHLLPDRDIADIYLEMGRIETRSGNLDQARSSLNRCIGLAERLASGQPLLRQAYAALGKGYVREGRLVNALEAFEQALNHGYGPDMDGYWNLRFHMAQAHLENGDYERAEPLLIEISEQGDGPLQQRVRIRLGMLGLEKQLDRLSGWTR